MNTGQLPQWHYHGNCGIDNKEFLYDNLGNQLTLKVTRADSRLRKFDWLLISARLVKGEDELYGFAGVEVEGGVVF